MAQEPPQPVAEPPLPPLDWMKLDRDTQLPMFAKLVNARDTGNTLSFGGGTPPHALPHQLRFTLAGDNGLSVEKMTRFLTALGETVHPTIVDGMARKESAVARERNDTVVAIALDRIPVKMQHPLSEAVENAHAFLQIRKALEQDDHDWKIHGDRPLEINALVYGGLSRVQKAFRQQGIEFEDELIESQDIRSVKLRIDDPASVRRLRECLEHTVHLQSLFLG
jgi:hypothetical protein